jgi:hypothetical protein
MPKVLSFAVLPLALVVMMGCAGSTDDAAVGAEPELNAKSALAAGDFAMLESAGSQLSTIGCRHYMNLHVGAASKVTLAPRLDSADPHDMDPDGSCGGEELPKNSATDYPLTFVSRSSCGAGVYEGTIKWTTDGKVTRKMRLTDARGSTCKAKARVVAEITSTYQGQTNAIATYYSVDPR